MVPVTTAVNVTRSPALSTVPAAGTTEFNVIWSAVGAVGLSLAQPATKKQPSPNATVNTSLLVPMALPRADVNTGTAPFPVHAGEAPATTAAGMSNLYIQAAITIAAMRRPRFVQHVR